MYIFRAKHLILDMQLVCFSLGKMIFFLLLFLICLYFFMRIRPHELSVIHFAMLIIVVHVQLMFGQLFGES